MRYVVLAMALLVSVDAHAYTRWRNLSPAELQHMSDTNREIERRNSERFGGPPGASCNGAGCDWRCQFAPQRAHEPRCSGVGIYRED